jgi:hypothetical protein
VWEYLRQIIEKEIEDEAVSEFSGEVRIENSSPILRLQSEMAEIQFLKERMIGLGTRAMQP